MSIEESKVQGSDELREKAETLLSLVNVLDGIRHGRIRCTGTVKSDIESLIMNLCEEIFYSLN